jgi:NAD(P)-dependent dehydrogenase (short-subunit alcohol dehydrogenase family)
MNLTGQRILVIGGSSGMGLASARLLAEAGGAAIIASRSKKKLDAALETLPKGVMARAVDFTDRAALDQTHGGNRRARPSVAGHQSRGGTFSYRASSRPPILHP